MELDLNRSENMYVIELNEKTKKKIKREKNPPYPKCVSSPETAITWFDSIEEIKEDLKVYARIHNQDREKTKANVKCVMNLPVIVSFSNNHDKDVWIEKIEANPHKFMELFNKRHIE